YRRPERSAAIEHARENPPAHGSTVLLVSCSASSNRRDEGVCGALSRAPTTTPGRNGCPSPYRPSVFACSVLVSRLHANRSPRISSCLRRTANSCAWRERPLTPSLHLPTAWSSSTLPGSLPWRRERWTAGRHPCG